MDKKTAALFYTAFIGGTLLRIFGITHQSVWIDEYCTAMFASRDSFFYMFWETMSKDMHPPLFYTLEFIVHKLFGFNEFTLRMLPMIFGIALIPVVYKFTRAFFSERSAMAAMWLFAFNPYQIYYAQEARSYSLFLLVSIMMLYYFMLSMKYNSFTFGPFVFWSITGIYTHSYAVLLLLIMNILIFTRYRDELRLNLWIKAQLIIAAAALPMIMFFIKGAAGDQYSHNVNMFMAPFYAIKNYLFGFTIDFNFFTVLGMIFALYYIVLGVFTRAGKDKRMTETLWITGLFYVVVPWLISMWKPMYSERTFMLASVIVLVLIAVGTTYLLRNGMIALFMVFAVLYTVSLSNYYFVPSYQKTEYKPAIMKIINDYKEGDVIVHSNVASYTSFEFYNRIMYNAKIENRHLSEIPEFKGSGMRFKIREAWRLFKDKVLKEKFKLDIYAGYDKNMLPEKDAMTMMKNYKRVYYIRDSKEGIKQVWLPVGNVWAASYAQMGISDPAEPETVPWVSRYFRITGKEQKRGYDIFTLERLNAAE